MNGTTRKLLITLHVAVAVSVLGVDIVLITLGLAGYAMAPAAMYPAAQLIGQQVLWPLALAALASGVAVALVGPYGLFRFWWTTVKLAITVGLTGLLAFVLLPALSAAGTAAATGETVAASRQLMLTLGPVASTSLLLANVALAVFKPKWRFAGAPRRSEVAA